MLGGWGIASIIKLQQPINFFQLNFLNPFPVGGSNFGQHKKKYIYIYIDTYTPDFALIKHVKSFFSIYFVVVRANFVNSWIVLINHEDLRSMEI